MPIPLRRRDDDDGWHAWNDWDAERIGGGMIIAVAVACGRSQELIDIDHMAEGRTEIGMQRRISAALDPSYAHQLRQGDHVPDLRARPGTRPLPPPSG